MSQSNMLLGFTWQSRIAESLLNIALGNCRLKFILKGPVYLKLLK